MIIDKNAKIFSYPSQLAIVLGLTLAGLIISGILSVAIWFIMEGATFPLKSEDLFQPRYYNVNMVIQVVSTFFLFFASAWAFAAICYRKPAIFLGLNPRVSWRQVFLVIGMLILTFPLSGALGELNQALPIPQSWAIYFKKLEVSREAQEAALIQINSFSKYIISLVVIAILPALFEEIYFRAAIQNLFTRWFKGPWPAIILTSIIFSAIHASYYGFLVRFGLGLILGLVFYYSRSLWLSVLIHFLFNGIQVTALYQMNMQGAKKAKDIEQNFPLWAGVVAFVLLIYLFRLFRKASSVELGKYPAEEFFKEKLPEDDFQKWLNQP